MLLTILALFKQAMVKDTFIVFLLTLSVLQLMLGVDRQIVDPIRFWVWDRLGDTQTLMAFGINYLSWVVTGFLWGAMLVLCLGKYGVRTLIMSVFIIIVKVIFDWGAAAPVISALQVLVFVLMPFLMGGLLIHAKAVSNALARPVERQAR